jgi:hypothetical protein
MYSPLPRGTNPHAPQYSAHMQVMIRNEIRAESQYAKPKMPRSSSASHSSTNGASQAHRKTHPVSRYEIDDDDDNELVLAPCLLPSPIRAPGTPYAREGAVYWHSSSHMS